MILYSCPLLVRWQAPTMACLSSRSTRCGPSSSSFRELPRPHPSRTTHRQTDSKNLNVLIYIQMTTHVHGPDKSDFCYTAKQTAVTRMLSSINENPGSSDQQEYRQTRSKQLHSLPSSFSLSVISSCGL